MFARHKSNEEIDTTNVNRSLGLWLKPLLASQASTDTNSLNTQDTSVSVNLPLGTPFPKDVIILEASSSPDSSSQLIESQVSVNIKTSNSFEGLVLDVQPPPEFDPNFDQQSTFNPAILKRPQRPYVKVDSIQAPINDVKIKKHQCVAKGTMHQGHISLATAEGLQCVFLATTAAALSQIKNRVPFTTRDIDIILKDGTKTYLTYLNNMKPRLMDPERDMPVHFDVDSCTVVISAPEWVVNGLYVNTDSYKELSTLLQQIFIENALESSYVFTFQSYTTSFWRTNDHFFLFNSHGVGENGTHDHVNDAENKARLFRFDDVDTLAKMLLVDGRSIDNNQYSIHKMHVQNHLPIGRLSSFDSELVIHDSLNDVDTSLTTTKKNKRGRPQKNTRCSKKVLNLKKEEKMDVAQVPIGNHLCLPVNELVSSFDSELVIHDSLNDIDTSLTTTKKNKRGRPKKNTRCSKKVLNLKEEEEKMDVAQVPIGNNVCLPVGDTYSVSSSAFNFEQESCINTGLVFSPLPLQNHTQDRIECVARGEMHQGEIDNGQNLQCAVLSTAGAALSVVRQRQTLSMDDINTILIDGTKIYLQLVNGRPDVLSPSVVPSQLELGNYTINIIPPVWIVNGEYPFQQIENINEIDEMKNILKSIFNDESYDPLKDSFIFTFQQYTTSFWCSHGSFYLFNSHAVDIDGKLNTNIEEVNKARLFKISDAEALAELLLINGEYGREYNQYSIHKVSVTGFSLDLECLESDDSQTTTSTMTSVTTSVSKKRKKRKSVFSTKKQKTDRQAKYLQSHPEVRRRKNKKYDETHPNINLLAVEKYKTNKREEVQAKNKLYNTLRKIPIKLRKKGLIGELSDDMLDEVEPYRFKYTSLHSRDAIQCPHCKAKFFDEESQRTAFCCGSKRFNVLQLPPLNEQFYQDPLFIRHSRAYNNLFAFSALGTSGGSVQIPPGFGFVKIQGRTYHRIFDLSYTGSVNPLRMYIYDHTSRDTEAQKFSLNKEILTEITHFVHEVNPYIDHFRRLSLEPSDQAFVVFKRTTRAADGAVIGSNVSPDTEVAALISCNPQDVLPRSVAVWKVGDARPHTISPFSELYEPFHYTLLYPHGTPGWYLNRPDNNGKKLTLQKYCRCLMLSDYRFSDLGRLSEEWIVDMFVRAQEERFNYLKKAQNLRFRQAPLDELVDVEAINTLNDIARDETILAEDDGIVPGRIYLPSSHTGSPRYLQTKYMDGIALVARLGRPSFFVTFTCNPNWPEIVQSRRPNASLSPVLIARVFQLKLQTLMYDIHHGQYFGPVDYHMYVIEYQKRGLPHAHICFRVKDGGPVQNADIDRFVRADIPPADIAGGRLRELVLKHMIHGPCGEGHHVDLACWNTEKKKCDRYFPRLATDVTYVDKKGFVIYKRNPSNVVCHQFRNKTSEISDLWVVPYNPALLLRYDTHINVEIAATRKIIKYLFKYIHKGPDKAVIAVTAENPNAPPLPPPIVSDNGGVQPSPPEPHDEDAAAAAAAGADVDRNHRPPVNEIEDFATTRFVGSCEASWRLLAFDTVRRYPAIKQLHVHLEGRQSVIFQLKGRQLPNLENASSDLLIYFNRPQGAEFDVMTYQQFYERYIIHASKPKNTTKFFEISDGKHYATERQKGEAVARLYWVTPKRAELFYLRMLLAKYPCRSYTDLLRLGGQGCDTFQQAARFVGLADDQNEYEKALKEAAGFCTGNKLRSFYVLLICNGAPALILWENMKDSICEDFLERYSDRERAFREALIQIDRLLRRHGSSNVEQGLPEVVDDTTEYGREVAEYSAERRYSELVTFYERWLPLLSSEQNNVFGHVQYLLTNNNDLASDAKTAMFIDGAAGTGKTLLLNLIAAYVRSTKSSVAICVALSGIAALNYDSGTTAHSMFKLPIDFGGDSGVWNLTNTSQRAHLIREAKVIIFDEAPMCHKYLIHMLDRSLRDLMQCPQRLFGGKIIIFAGDFRQIPPVVTTAKCPNDVFEASLKSSPLWSQLYKFSLCQAQRTRTDSSYSDFLLKLGSGLLDTVQIGVDVSTQNLISLQDMNATIHLDHLIDFVFPTELLANSDECAKRAIITTHNVNVRNINNILIEKVPGEEFHLYSVDKVEDDMAREFIYGPDTLNQVRHNQAPDHHLFLKKGCVCMIMRNLNFGSRLVNGTKVIIVHATPLVVYVRKPDSAEDDIEPISRIDFQIPIETGSPVNMTRKQFPLQLCYAITVHKSQGQTIERVGVDLRSDIFSHGQLYVALGRVRNRDDILVLVNTKRIFNDIPYANNVIHRKLID